MELHGWISLIVLVVAAVLFLTRWLPLELTALGIPVVLFATGTVTDPAVVLAGFGNRAVIALAAVFVLGAGLQESGVATRIGRVVQRLGGTSETRLILVICVAVASLSAFMSNAATVAVLLPAVISVTRHAAVSPSRLLMPMGFAAILGGNLTLIGTAPNLLLSDHLRQHAGRGFGMFDFALVGLPIALLGTLYLATLGRRLLPKAPRGATNAGAHLPERLAEEYGMAHNLTRVRIGPQSRLAGKTLAAAQIGGRYGVSVVLIEHRGGLVSRWITPSPGYRLEVGDDLYLEGSDEAIWTLAEAEHTPIGLPSDENVRKVLSRGVCVAEIAVTPRAQVVGKTPRELDFRGRLGLSVLSIWRNGEPLRQGIADLALQAGDALLVAGPTARVRALEATSDFVVLSDPGDVENPRKAPVALLCLLVAMLPPVLGLAPFAISALGGALLMAGTGCVSMRDAGRFIEWRVLCMVVGTLPLGGALEQHGVADLAADAVVSSASVLGPAGVLAVLFGIAALLGSTSGNAAAAVILAPVAWNAAEAIGIAPRNALLAVAYGCSCAFAVPSAHQCNLMVMVPGGYRTRDFLVVGGVLSLVVTAVAVGMLATL